MIAFRSGKGMILVDDKLFDVFRPLPGYTEYYISVSYTHLDVYKRQEHCIVVILLVFIALIQRQEPFVGEKPQHKLFLGFVRLR